MQARRAHEDPLPGQPQTGTPKTLLPGLEKNEKIRPLVPKERLLEYNVKEGWGPLCKFWGEVPNELFPKRNHTAEFNAPVAYFRTL
jgi:Sulfotransferase domain